jgi:hypothetical protein
MSLAAAMVAHFFSSPNVTVGLAAAGVELAGVGGYRRHTTPRWEVRGPNATVRLEWGPFTSPVRFDEAVLYDGNKMIERFHIGPWQIPAGGTHSTELFVEVD